VTRYTFDPNRLRGTAKQQEQAGYAVVGQMLREYLVGDPPTENAEAGTVRLATRERAAGMATSGGNDGERQS
jgi:hypothetical protein